MPPIEWLNQWAIFVGWRELWLALSALLLVLLLLIWWQQQTRHWFRIGAGTLLFALLLAIGSYYLFIVPPYQAGCSSLCTGWRGFPFRFAVLKADETVRIGQLDFALNLLMLWFLGLASSLIWYLLAYGLSWTRRGFRFRLLFLLWAVFLPWALLPRYLGPPQPTFYEEDLRLANNARRAAEHTYRITGLWVQRLALEDVRPVTSVPTASTNLQFYAVCLRGYVYFYIPWRRYRILLDGNGVLALEIRQVGLDETCW